MIRQPIAPGEHFEIEDRSMRFVEYALAMVAVAAAIILAVIR